MTGAQRQRVAGIDGIAEQAVRVPDLEAAVRRLLAVQPPRLPLGDRDEPGAPAAVPIRLAADELHPGEVASIVDDVGRRVDQLLDGPGELAVIAAQ
jgi:hypothetical protein